MKGFLLCLLGFVAAVVYFKWDDISRFVEEQGFSFDDRPDFSGGRPSHRASNPSSPTFAGRLVSDDDFETRLEVEQLAEEWSVGGKSSAIAALNRMKEVLDYKTKCPAYHYAPKLANEARSAIIKFEEAIGYDNHKGARELGEAAADAMRRFNTNCRWKPGVSAGNGTHIRSASQEGYWTPENGYRIANGGIWKVSPCRKCNKSGSVKVTENCYRCNGTGRIPNPAAQVSDALSAGTEIGTQALDIFSSFSKPRGRAQGRRSGNSFRPVRRPSVPQTLTCDTCNGSRRITRTVTCGECNGQCEIQTYVSPMPSWK